MNPIARSVVAVGSLVLGATLTTQVRADTPPAQQTTQAAPKEDTQGGGFVQLADEALSNVPLRQDQTDAIKKLGETVENATKPVEQAKGSFLEALAKSFASGKVEVADTREQIDALAHATDAAAPTVRAALERLHATLDTNQRTAFVSAFDTALRHRISTARDMRWADELGLTSDQKDRIRYIVAEDSFKMDAAIGRLVRVMAAFEGDEFALDEIAPLGEAGEHARRLAESLVRLSGRIADVLTPDQRQKVAQKIQSTAKIDQTGKISSPLEETGSTSEALWAVRGGGVGYRGVRGYGYARGYVGGMGYWF